MGASTSCKASRASKQRHARSSLMANQTRSAGLHSGAYARGQLLQRLQPLLLELMPLLLATLFEFLGRFADARNWLVHAFPISFYVLDGKDTHLMHGQQL